MNRFLIPFLLTILLCMSCNRDIDILAGNKPEVTFDTEDLYYEVKIGAETTISPTYKYVDDKTQYRWTVDDEPGFASGASYTRHWEREGTYYLTLAVTNSAGTTVEELRVDVVPRALPTISFPISGDCLLLRVGTEYLLTPEIGNRHTEGLSLQWTLNGEPTGTSESCLIKAEKVGEYILALTATNIDGTVTEEITVKVVETLPYELAFPSHSHFDPSTVRYTFPGRAVYLEPTMSGLEGNTYVWTVDGKVTECTSRHMIYTPDRPGEHTVSVLVDGHATASVRVVAVDATEEGRRRPFTGSSQAARVKVLEWCPAPGQFIGDPTSGMDGSETTLAAANAWAQGRLDKQWFVSLGGFGGYIVVGFDHSVPNVEGQMDFSVTGNALINPSAAGGGSNEPGVVYVMQDTNGNGLPDDEWYELHGSETGKPEVVSNYAVTYYRPSGPKMNVQWTDNLGNSGTVDHHDFFHPQPYYWPAWVAGASYTLRGTRLPSRTSQTESGNWDNRVFDWGYADNLGSDVIGGQQEGAPANGFKIENAVLPDNSPIHLKYIDFVKVQTGVNAKAGWLGEVSTEVLGFKDLSR